MFNKISLSYYIYSFYATNLHRKLSFFSFINYENGVRSPFVTLDASILLLRQFNLQNDFFFFTPRSNPKSRFYNRILEKHQNN